MKYSNRNTLYSDDLIDASFSLLKGTLSPGFLLFWVQFCPNYFLWPVIVQNWKCSYRINKMNLNEIWAGRANHILLVIFQCIAWHFEKTGKFIQISIHFNPRHLWWHKGVYSVNAVLQSLAAKLDHYFKVSTDALAVLSFLKWWYNSVTMPL